MMPYELMLRPRKEIGRLGGWEELRRVRELLLRGPRSSSKVPQGKLVYIPPLDLDLAELRDPERRSAPG